MLGESESNSNAKRNACSYAYSQIVNSYTDAGSDGCSDADSHRQIAGLAPFGFLVVWFLFHLVFFLFGV